MGMRNCYVFLQLIVRGPVKETGAQTDQMTWRQGEKTFIEVRHYFNSVSTNSQTPPSTNLFREPASLAARSSGGVSEKEIHAHQKRSKHLRRGEQNPALFQILTRVDREYDMTVVYAPDETLQFSGQSL